MAQASSLKDLLQIRHANNQFLNSIDGGLGSALGIKKASDPSHPDNGKPAILVFVRNKIAAKWLPSSQQIPKKMLGPNGLECPVDVIEGDRRGRYDLLYSRGKGNPPGQISYFKLRGQPKLSAAQLRLRDDLRGWGEKITAGAELAAINPERSWVGTLTCFAKDRATGHLGLITNEHVAKDVGQALHFGATSARQLATVDRKYTWVQDEIRFAGIIDEPNATYRVDCAFAPLDGGIDKDKDISTALPIVGEDGSLQNVAIGDPVPLDLDTMGLIGDQVIGVGRTMSFQRGTVVGFAYEYRESQGKSRYTDYLILGDDGDLFSERGDSGKLLFTDEEKPRPVALLSGGRREKLANQEQLRKWSYATDINLVLDILKVDIFRS